MKKMEDNKNIIIIILFIFVLFFVSNDKNVNKIFHKNIIKILFLITLIYMIYLKINIGIILVIFFIFLLFNTNVGKKLQKNKYIKRMIKYFSPYITPIIHSIEDIVYSFTNIPDDDSSVGSIKNKRVKFQDEEDNDDDYQIDYDNIDDIELFDENKEEDNDLLDEIRKNMIPSNIDETSLRQEVENIMDSTPINEIVDEDDISDEIKKLDPNEVRELYNEMNLLKSQLNKS
jgi:hypothetical protein